MRASRVLPFLLALGVGGGCAVMRTGSMADPRDGTVLTLIRSAEGRGDYEPRPLRYGVREGELLRVECASASAVAIVKR